jgi:alkylhydroperoxidase/carboxymuconolactone decarboxylase family protein YurZ
MRREQHDAGMTAGMHVQIDLDRANLDARTRLLLFCVVAIQPADWELFRASIRAARERALVRAEFDEALMQATLFFGFPRVVTAFEQFQEAWPRTEPSTGLSVPVEDHFRQGRALFAAIYGKNDEAVRNKLASFHQDFHDFVLEAAYGRILCRKGLDLLTRELLATGALAVLDQIPQLVAHARGAIQFGATPDAIREVLRCARFDDARIDSAMQRIEGERRSAAR